MGAFRAAAIGLVFASVTLAGCGPSAETQTVEARLSLVKAFLNDPYSARFEGLSLIDETTLCGTVNGKNPFGAYVGARRFAATASEVLIDPADMNTASRVVWSYGDQASLERYRAAMAADSAAIQMKTRIVEICMKPGKPVPTPNATDA